MTELTSLPQNSNPLLREGISDLLSLVSIKGIHSPAVNLGPGEQDEAPWQEPGEATGATAAKPVAFAEGLSGPRGPLSPGECPPVP